MSRSSAKLANTGPARDRPPERFTSREFVLLAGLFGLAVLLRCFVWMRTVVMFSDGPEFIGLARALEAGDESAVLRHDYHPLYPALLMLAHLAGADWENAGAAVSIVAGAAGVPLLYLLLRDVFGRPIAGLGALLLAIHPRAVEFSSDVGSDALYLTLLLAALSIGWRALCRRSGLGAAGAGVAAGLAYLTRPEGLVAALALATTAGLRLLSRRWSPLATAGWLAALAGGVALCVLPYVGALRAETGAWMLTQKKSVRVLAGLEAAPTPTPRAVQPADPTSPTRPPAPEQATTTVPREPAAPTASPEPAETGGGLLTTLLRILESSSWVVRVAIASLRYDILLFFLLGAVALRGRPSAGARFLLLTGLLQMAMLVALTLQYGYLSKRHTFPLVVLTFGIVAAGIPVAGRALLALGRRLRLGLPDSPRAALAAGLVLLALFALPRQLEPKRGERRAQREAAEWLREHRRPEAVAVNRLRVAYYAGARFVSLRGSDGLDLESLRARGAQYVIVDEHAQIQQLGLDSASSSRLLHHVDRGDQQAWIFELHDP